MNMLNDKDAAILRELEQMGSPYLADCGREYELVASKLSTPRLLHSLGVAATAARLAEKYKAAEPDKAYLAGLCHDIAKEIPKDEMFALVKRSALADDEGVLTHRVLWHAPAGSVLLADYQREYPSFDLAIQSACLWHTLGRPKMTGLEQVVYVADLIEPGRDFPDLAEIRRAAAKSLADGICACMYGAIKFLELEGRYVHPLAYEGWQYYRQFVE